MKIIDLLNKIANGEEVPKKIKYRNDIYILLDNYCYYCNETNLILSDRIFAEPSRLNDEVEILEEPKGMPEKLHIYDCIDAYSKFDVNDNRKTINEIIDYLESKGE